MSVVYFIVTIFSYFYVLYFNNSYLFDDSLLTKSFILGFSKGWKESFMSGDQEPWVFRGGLVADLQVSKTIEKVKYKLFFE